MARQRFSPRDEVYLNSTSFEVYMITGAVWLALFTASFIFSVVTKKYLLLWPGAFVSVLTAYFVLKMLERREYRAKLHELEAEVEQRERTA